MNKTTPQTTYLCMTPHFWGASPRKADAIRNCRGAGGSSMMKKHGFVIYEIDSRFTVDDVNGDVFIPQGGRKGVVVEDRRKKR